MAAAEAEEIAVTRVKIDERCIWCLVVLVLKLDAKGKLTVEIKYPCDAT